ncbi:Septin-domain-containing protein [Chaetomium fimeti]|uniref:Septin-domain-containing protein n=1 Tax=Chaetomium fimeti TaxID=1854472 RepID=A0AAE0LSS5_9PEZI|nr:Septin-domain-containing protein [Chaetomium fimeti]
MRPLSGDDAHGRACTSDPDGFSTFRLPTAPQMTYMLGDEATIGSSSQIPPAPQRRVKEQRAAPYTEHPEHSKPRVPTHHDFERNKESKARPTSSKGPVDALRHEDYDAPRAVSPFPRSADTPSLSQPLTPALLGASGPASALSSMSSRRNSLCLSEDLPSFPPSMRGGDIAVEDDEDDEERSEDPAGRGGEGDTSCDSSAMMDSGSAPQLVMPSIKMPSRRPFTDDGKRMGRLKVLIAGDSGVGKTSLIKAIVQSCEHIVHVDPITPSALLSASAMGRSTQTAGSGSPMSRKSRKQSARGSLSGTSQITEIYASTKPYPEWWSEVDDVPVLRRRKSLGDAVLDRNVCFVDTPGYGSGSSSMDTITPVAQYIEAHLQRINSNFLTDGDLLNLLGGEGGVQVDAVFYLVSNRLRPVDIEYLRQLYPLTNIIILLAQTDLMSPNQVAASKSQIHSQLKEASIRLFSFSLPASADTDNQGVYAISSAAGPDHETMDASLLMSPDYVQPLTPTELSALVSEVFTPAGVARLRHAVARKYVQWRKPDSPNHTPSLFSNPPSLTGNHALPLHLTNPFTSPTFTPTTGGGRPQNDILTPVGTNTNTSPGGGSGMGTPSSSYALARLADHTQREERLAQVRLANWAADLQRSLAREREQYAAVARRDRAVWLAERLGECVRDDGGEGGGGEGDGVEGGGLPVVVADHHRRHRSHGRDVARGRRHGGRRVRGGSGGDALAEQLGAWGLGYGPLEQQQAQGQGHNQCREHGAGDGQCQRHRQDPLGLLEVADELRHRGLLALEVLGSIGVLGGLALWVTRHYLHVQSPPAGWLPGEWERFWYGVR